MGQKTRNHRTLQTTGEVPETVEKLYLSLEALLKNKSQELGKLFSQEEFHLFLTKTLELAREGFVSDWSLGLSAFGADPPVVNFSIELYPVQGEIRSELLKLAAQKGLELFAQAKEHESKTGSK